MGSFKLVSSDGDDVIAGQSGGCTSGTIGGPIKGFEYAKGAVLLDRIFIIYEDSPSCDHFLVSSFFVSTSPINTIQVELAELTANPYPHQIIATSSSPWSSTCNSESVI